MAELFVEVVSPDQNVWAGEATMVVARTTEGELGILPGHTPLLGELVASPVRVKRTSGRDLHVRVQGGFLSVSRDTVHVLAEQLELAEGDGDSLPSSAADATP